MDAASILPALPTGARILVVRLRSIGDIVLLTPALRILKEWRPDLRISVALESRFRELLEGNLDVAEILELENGRGLRKISLRLLAAREIRRRHFSLAANLHGGPTSAFLTRWSGAPLKVGFHHYRGRRMYEVLIPDAREILGKPSLHSAELQACAFFHLGLPLSEVPRARLFTSPRHQAWWEEKRSALGLASGQDYAVIHPAALYATKQWAVENFARLGQYLEREKKLQAVYSVGPGETAVLNAVQRAAQGPIRRLERASLGEFAAALAGARLFVGNDSGPAHMAMALGLPSVVIFGSSSSAIWGPWPPPVPPDTSAPRASASWARVVQNSYECNPCPGDRCYRFNRPECILSVTSEQVCSAVEDVLKQSATERTADPSLRSEPALTDGKG